MGGGNTVNLPAVASERVRVPGLIGLGWQPLPPSFSAIANRIDSGGFCHALRKFRPRIDLTR